MHKVHLTSTSALPKGFANILIRKHLKYLADRNLTKLPLSKNPTSKRWKRARPLSKSGTVIHPTPNLADGSDVGDGHNPEADSSLPNLMHVSLEGLPSINSALTDLQNREAGTQRNYEKYAEVIMNTTEAVNIGEVLLLVHEKFKASSGTGTTKGAVLVELIESGQASTSDDGNPSVLVATLIVKEFERLIREHYKVEEGEELLKEVLCNEMQWGSSSEGSVELDHAA